MLEMRPLCERCSKALPADVEGALICSFECTFCTTCNEAELSGICPNCAGRLAVRPTRVGKALEKYPPKAQA